MVVGASPGAKKAPGELVRGLSDAAQWVGGGKIHTPKPRDYAKKMPRKMRQAALRSALSAKAAAAELVVLDELTLPEPKTRLMDAGFEKTGR